MPKSTPSKGRPAHRCSECGWETAKWVGRCGECQAWGSVVEESASQVRLRADRTGGVHDELYLAAETDLGAILTHIEQVRPTLVVVDSIQTIAAGDLDGVPGGVSQVKEVAAALIRVAKTRNI